MNETDRELLERTLTLSEENNKILKSLRHAQRLSMFWGVIKLVVIILPFVLGYFYLKPYLGSLGGSSGTGFSMSSFTDLINAYKQ